MRSTSPSDETFRLIVEAAPNAIVVIDESGRIVLVNSQTEKLFGYARGEVIGGPVEMLVPERFRGSHPALRQAFFVDAQARPMGAGRDLFGLRRDGSEFPVEIGLNPIRTDRGVLVLSAIVDITERQRAERRFRLAIESAPSGMVMVDQQGQIVMVNSQAEKVFGYAREELIGQNVEILVPEPLRGHAELADASPGVATGREERRVLIVDDNVDAAESIAMLLQASGFSVRCVYDGISALSVASAYRPHVIVLDIGLPDISGYEVAKRLRAQPDFERTPIVAVTGYGQRSDRLRSQEAGIDHHMLKPVDPEVLQALLAAVPVASSCS